MSLFIGTFSCGSRKYQKDLKKVFSLSYGLSLLTSFLDGLSRIEEILVIFQSIPTPTTKRLNKFHILINGRNDRATLSYRGCVIAAVAYDH